VRHNSPYPNRSHWKRVNHVCVRDSVLSVLVKVFGKVTSFSTTLEVSPIFSDNEDACSEASSLSSPVASMEKMGTILRFIITVGLDSPASPKRRRLEVAPSPATAATSFLDKLRASIDRTSVQPPPLPTHPYEYGKLPFQVDWEVWRVDTYAINATLRLNDVKSFFPKLSQNVNNPKVLWSQLRSRVESNEVRVAVDFPEPSSSRAWEILQSRGWNDGRVHLVLKLECSDSGKCRYLPQPMAVGGSCRAYRKFGADRFLMVSINDKALFQFTRAIDDYLKRPVEICGRTYRIFFIKKTVAHFFATDGPGIESIPLSSLMDWLVALTRNRSMTSAKLFSRIGMALSSTTSTLVFQPSQIRIVRDIVSPAGECMTDGCARASPAVFREIWRGEYLGAKETPTAVQARLGGAKGVWYVDPLADARSDELWIEIREGSQLKFQHDKLAVEEDPTLRTLVAFFVR
jgi:RNA dependent RNA polymerase